MKKLLYFVVSVLSLAVIFAAGWASGVGTVAGHEEQPAAVRSENVTDDSHECPENDKCPDCEDGTENNLRRHKHGFRIKLPFPPIERDDTIRPPKSVN